MSDKLNDELQHVVVLLRDEEVAINPSINKLHYLLTSFFLIVSSLVMTAHYIGNTPIACSPAKLSNHGKVQRSIATFPLAALL